MHDSPQLISTLLGLLAVVVLVAANGFFVAAEFALVGARRTRLAEMARGGDTKARLALKAVDSLDRYIGATQLGITLASLGLGWLGEPALAHLVGGLFGWLDQPLSATATHALAVAVAFSIITVLHIILGELVPKALALLYPERLSAYLAAPVMGFAWVMYVPTKLLNETANWLLKICGIRASMSHERLHSAEEIRLLVEQSHEGGGMLQQDARLIKGVFEFSEKTAHEVMTPRTEMMALPVSLTVEAAADRIATARRSRYPVHGESLDDIVGVVHAKDILGAVRTSPSSGLAEIMRPPIFVPRTREVGKLLAEMKRRREHLVLVVDEYGGTAGLVTMEDVLEEIVGKIYDEYDRPDQSRSAPDGAILLDGSMPIREFNTRFEAEMDETRGTTLGGYLFLQIGRLPKVGDRVETDGRTFEIAQMQGRRVKRVLLRPTG